jgi:hypothetical protein
MRPRDGDLVLLVRCLTQLCSGHCLHIIGPPPARLHGDPSYLRAAGQVEQLQSPVLPFSDFVRIVERPELQGLRLRHLDPSSISLVVKLTFLAAS